MDEIQQQRQELGDNLQQLENKVRDTVDWRVQFSERPMAGIGIAFAGGFLLSMLMPGGGESKGRSSQTYEMSNYRVDDDATRAQPVSYRYQYPPSDRGEHKGRSMMATPEMKEVTDTLENIRGAVMGMAASRLRDFLAEAVPGFANEYEEARKSRGASEATKLSDDAKANARPATQMTDSDRQRTMQDMTSQTPHYTERTSDTISTPRT
jgi:hypothetical protein